MINYSNFGIIVVLYYPNSENLSNLISNLNSECNIIIVDNTPEVCLKNSFLLNNNVHYFAFNFNKGIACAQNFAISHIASYHSGIQFLLFLDQDSIINNNFLDIMYNEYLRLNNINPLISIVAPILIDIETNEYFPKCKQNYNDTSDYYCTDIVISSGLFTNISLFSKVGFFKEDFFIDYVDFEWCWRAKTYNYICVVTKNVQLLHKVGISRFSFLKHRFILSPPLRYFYQNRNFIKLLKLNYVPLSWKFKNLIKKVFLLFYVPLKIKDGFTYFKFMIRGFITGIFNQ
jgi:rhamnosyltransferase